MSARARRAIACANRSSRSAHPPAQYPTCREARTGTSHACRTRTAQLALAAAAIRFRVAAMLPAATQAGTYLGTTHRQAGVPRKRPAGRRRASEAPPSTKKAEPTPTRRYRKWRFCCPRRRFGEFRRPFARSEDPFPKTTEDRRGALANSVQAHRARGTGCAGQGEHSLAPAACTTHCDDCLCAFRQNHFGWTSSSRFVRRNCGLIMVSCSPR